jgi:hypothetical protein
MYRPAERNLSRTNKPVGLQLLLEVLLCPTPLARTAPPENQHGARISDRTKYSIGKEESSERQKKELVGRLVHIFTSAAAFRGHIPASGRRNPATLVPLQIDAGSLEPVDFKSAFELSTEFSPLPQGPLITDQRDGPRRDPM